MSIIPNNGSIVIIDDKFEEAYPLMQFLSKENKSYRYFSGDRQNLPDVEQNQDSEAVRLVFLDYILNEGVNDEKQHINTLNSVLNRIIKSDNGPYFILLWSKEDDELVSKIETVLVKKPQKIINLRKSDYFKSENNSSVFTDNIDDLRNVIQSSIKELALLEFLSKWENQVTVASQKLLSKVSDIVDPSNEATDAVAKVLVHHLAKINLEQSIQKLEDSDIHVAAYQTLNTVFSTYLNHKSGELSLEHKEFQNLKSLSSSNGINKCKLNSWLNINQLPNPSHLGEVFATEESCFYDWNIVKDSSNQGKFIENVKQLKTDDDYFQTVELEISPECDVAQNKRQFYRIVPGVLVSVGLLKKIYNDLPSKLGKDEKNKYYIYCFGKDKSDKSDTPKTVLKLNAPQTVFGTKEFELKNNGTTHAVVLILDLSQFKTVPMVINDKDYFEDKESLFSLNSDLLQAIKNSLANNIQKKGYQGL